MPEYIVKVKQDNTIDLPIEVRDKMALEPGDKMIIRLDNAEEHMVMGKLPMDANEKAQEIDNVLGQRIKINKINSH